MTFDSRCDKLFSFISLGVADMKSSFSNTFEFIHHLLTSHRWILNVKKIHSKKFHETK